MTDNTAADHSVAISARAPIPELSEDVASPETDSQASKGQGKPHTAMENAVVGRDVVTPEATAKNRIDIIYEEEHMAKEWRIRPKDDQSWNQQNCVLRVLTKLPKDADDVERTTVEVKPPELRKVFNLIFSDTTAFAWGKAHDVDPKWLFWARIRLQDAERSFVNASYTDQRHLELLYMVRTALKFSEKHYAKALSSQIAGIETLEELRVSYDDLWTLFPPNVLVTGADELLSHPRVWQVLDTNYIEAGPLQEKLFAIWASFEEWNGAKRGTAVNVLKIKNYRGAKPLSELSVCPLYLTPNQAAIKKCIMERSEKQLSLNRVSNKLQRYTGNGIVLNKEKKPVELERFYFRGNVMVDPSKTLEACPDDLMPRLRLFSSVDHSDSEVDISKPDGKPSTEESLLERIEWILNENDASLLSQESTMANVVPVENTHDAAGHRQPEKCDNGDVVRHGPAQRPPKIISQYRLLLYSGIVYGYSFNTQSWGGFSVSELEDVEWSETAFDALVVDPHFKDQLGLLVTAYSRPERAIDDFITGKGRGLIGLLFGEPGLGKTFTAEAIAQMARLPLMSVSAGALGADPTVIDQRLTEQLQLAARWRAVVLFDEADVFMAKRDSKSIERNAVVSVFLRELEYYSGIMLLTTNKQEDIDTAFRSRIHFCYKYPPLDSTAREKIWKGFISQATRSGSLRVDINPAGYEDLAKEEYNGRQIKNIMTMASMLALELSPPVLTINSIMNVASTFQNWDDIERPRKREGGLSAVASDSPFASTAVKSRGVARMAAARFLGWVSLAMLALGLVSGSLDGLTGSVTALIARGNKLFAE